MDVKYRCEDSDYDDQIEVAYDDHDASDVEDGIGNTGERLVGDGAGDGAGLANDIGGCAPWLCTARREYGNGQLCRLPPSRLSNVWA